jgi:uncharacterized repeat protein (TIGR03803 family)
VVFVLNTATGKFKTLYNFNGNEDGYSPYGPLIIENDVLYGTNSEGGNGNNGTVFKLNLRTKILTPLHAFTGAADGGTPVAGVLFVNGVLYGTTYQGGTYGVGTVFKIVP